MIIMTIMKKIFFALVAIFGLWSCVQEELPFVNGNDPVVGEGDIVVEGSIYVPAIHDATRTFGNESITKLDILVFDENGYLIQDTEGTPVVIEGTEGTTVGSFGVAKDTEYKYTVALGQSNYKRTIHFVAYNDQIVSFPSYTMGQHMRYVVDVLTTTDTKEAFWGVVDLPNGITGTKAVNSTTFEPSAEVKTLLTKVPLVRNYANVTLTNNASSYLANAEIMLYNIPDKGSVVARITDSRYAQFAKRSGTTNTEKTYAEISEDYVGYEPAGMTLSNSAWGTSLYMYERHQQSGGNSVNTPAFAIIRGNYVSSTGTDSDYTYYKIDLCYTDDTTNARVLYNLLRNMRYNIILNSVSGRGESTPEAAAEGAAANNVSFSVETINLTNISDGERRLSVEYTEKVLTSGNTQYTLKYKYEPDISTGATQNKDVQFSGLTGDVIASYNIGTDDDKDGWRTFTFTSAAIDGVKMQSIVLTAGNLQRQVRYILGNPYTMRLDVAKKIADEVGTGLPAKVILPVGLPDGVFPLDIYVISENNSLTSSMPVITGLDNNATPATDGKYFGFVVTVEADDYFVNDANGNRVEGEYNTEFPVDLKTNMTGAAPAYTDGAAGTGTLVTAYNPYFYPATDEFWVGKPYGLDLNISGFTTTTATATFNIHTNQEEAPSIDAEDWSKDSSDNLYFDFDFIFSNSSVSLTGASFTGMTEQQKEYVKVVDNNTTLRVYKTIYDAGIRNFDLTFTSASSIMGTTITAQHAAFGTASASVEKYEISWSLGSFNASDGDEQSLQITMPQNLVSSLFPIELTISVKELTRTNLQINNSDNLSVNESVTITVDKSDYDSNRIISVPLKATRTDRGPSAKFTISLTTDKTSMFTNPADITKNKSRNGTNYE